MGDPRQKSRKKQARRKTYRYLREIICNHIKPFKYLLKPIEYKIKFLHPCDIPYTDPRRPFYDKKLREYLRKRRSEV